MNFGIALEVDAEADRRSALVERISDSLNRFLHDKEYGGGIEHLFVGFIGERLVPGFPSFAKKEREPKFETSQSVPLLGGGRRELRNTFTYDVKLDPARYERFVSVQEDEAMAIVVDLLVESLSKLDQVPEEVQSFDVEAFKAEVSKHLRKLVRA